MFSNLEHGLAILQRVLVHSNLHYTTFLVEVQSRSDAKPTLLLFVLHTKLDQTGLSWFELASTNMNCWCKVH